MTSLAQLERDESLGVDLRSKGEVEITSETIPSNPALEVLL
jgi:hypothetical protein